MCASTARALEGSGRTSSQQPMLARLRRPSAVIAATSSVAIAPLVSTTTASRTLPASSVKRTS